MLRIETNTADKAKVKKILETDPLFSAFGIDDDEDGFALSGMKYCTIIENAREGTFTLAGQQNEALDAYISNVFKDVPEIEIKGSLQLGSDNYRHFYWFESAPGDSKVKVDYAIDINELTALRKTNMGNPLSATWFHSIYVTDFGTEFVFFKTIDDFRERVDRAISDCDINEDDKLLGMNLMQVYHFLCKIMGASVGEIRDLKGIFGEIIKLYENDNTYDDQISSIIKNNIVPMASAIEGMNKYVVWANAVKKLLTKSKFFKLFKVEEDLEDLEDEDYIALLSQIAEEYEGFSDLECEDFIDLCDEYSISSEIEEDDFDEAKEEIDELGIPELEDEYM